MVEKQNKEDQMDFRLVEIFMKDFSFEAPTQINKVTDDWKPTVNHEFDITNTHWKDDYYEVSLKNTISVSNADKKLYLVELEHVGLFSIKGFEKEQMDHFFNTLCPEIIYPYSRQIISDAVRQSGYPPIYLNIISFEGVYRSKLKDKEQKA